MNSIDLDLLHSYNSKFQSWKDKPRYTLDYAPPELLADPNIVTYSPAVDIYGLGATLYAMLVGHPPYRQNARDVDHTPNTHHKLRKRMQREAFNQRSPRWLSASPASRHLVSWCMQRNPADRPKLQDILDSEWLQYGTNDPDVDIIVPAEQQVVVDLSEDTMEQPDQPKSSAPLRKSTVDEGITLVNEPAEETLANGPAATAAPPISDDEDLILHERFDPDDGLPVFYGFDENAPPLRLPEEYYVETPLPQQPQEERLEMPPPPAPAAPVAATTTVAEATTNRRPRTRQQRRTETLQRPNSLAETQAPEVDSKAGLYLLMQQLPPPAEAVVARIPRVQRTARTLPLPVGRSKRDDLEDHLLGFNKTPSSWRKSRASYRHFCLLLNGVQQVLKHRFKKERRVYALPTVKIEKIDEGYEKPLIFPRPKQRQPRAPKVYRPPTRVQPERARALRQRYVFE